MKSSPNQRPRTTSIGGATYDLFMQLDEAALQECSKETVIALPLGSKIRVQKVICECGGGASNTAVGLARLGCSAAVSTVIGDDQWGKNILENLKKEGVATEGLTIVEHETSGFAVILSSSTGERVIMYDPGTNAHLHDVTFDREAAANTDWVYLNHTQPNASVIEDDLIALLTSEPHPKLSWNPGGRQIKAGIEVANNRHLLAHTHLLLLNKEEALAFSKKDSVTEALKTLNALGANVVCITDGKNGAFATDGTSLYFCPIAEGPVVDTTGAGDAFGTGMTWGLLTGKSLQDALKAGTINAMSVVGAIGAQPGLLTDTEMHSKLRSLTLNVEVSSL